MTTKYEWATRTIDFDQTQADHSKMMWGNGPWQDEPDKVEWTDPATGFDCMIRRHPSSGHLCGYVGLPKSHAYFGKGYGDCSLPEKCKSDYSWCEHSIDCEISVHGGITYAAGCDGDADKGICHKKEDGDHVWWFGFDCAHGGDLSPGTSSRYPDLFGGEYESYWDVPMVKAETERLAAQLATI